MAETISCECGKALKVPAEAAGKKVRCPACGRTFVVPAPETGVTAARSAAPAKPAVAKPPPLPAEYDLPPPPAKAAAGRDGAADNDDEPDDDGELKTHAGISVFDSDDLFADAPPEIGRVLSAYSDLKKNKQPIPLPLRVGIILGGTFVAGLLPFVVLLILLRLHPATFLVPLVLALTTLGLTYYFTQFRYSCTYVGRSGLARFVCSGSRDNIVTEDILLFKVAAELRTAQTRHFYNGVYTGTSYDFTWTDDAGARVYALSGNYKSQEGNPKPSDPFHFALAAEIAWTEYLMRNVDRLTAGGGKLFFGLRGNDYVKMADGLLILHQSGKTTKLDVDDIDGVQVNQGVVAVREVGAKEGWFSSTGIHRFQYADLGNARFCLLALEKVVGVRFIG